MTKRPWLLLAAAAFAGCASAPREVEAPAATEGRREAGFVAREPAPVDIVVDSGDRELAAYDLTLVFDPALVRVTAVEPTGEFAAPQYLRSGLTSGELKLAAYQLERHPHGRVVVARVRFQAFGSAPSPLTVRLRTLADSRALPIRGRAEASRDRVP